MISETLQREESHTSCQMESIGISMILEQQEEGNNQNLFLVQQHSGEQYVQVKNYFSFFLLIIPKVPHCFSFLNTEKCIIPEHPVPDIDRSILSDELDVILSGNTGDNPETDESVKVESE